MEAAIQSRKIVEQCKSNGFSDDFTTEKLKLDWSVIRNFQKELYCLKKDRLQIKANHYTLSDENKSPAYLCIRQKEWIGTITLSINEASIASECGISLYHDHCHHIDFVLETSRTGLRTVFIRKCIGEIIYEEKKLKIHQQGNVLLKISCDETYYRFYYQKGMEEVEVGYTLCKHVATEVVDSMFVGVMCGIFANGDNAEAYFSYFKYDY